jgi:hypothetical protein
VKILTFSGLYGCVMSEGICARWASEWRFQLRSALTLDLYGKLLNFELKRFRRSYNMVKISFFIAAVVMLSACDVPFIPGI